MDTLGVVTEVNQDERKEDKEFYLYASEVEYENS